MNRQIWDAAETKAAAERGHGAHDALPRARGASLWCANAQVWNADEWETPPRLRRAPNPSTCLVLVVASVDKRRNWWKALQKTARVVECPHPSDAKLPEWIKQLAGEAALKLDPGVVQSLILRVGPDLQLLWREILKLQAYAGEDGRVAVDDVETLVGRAGAPRFSSSATRWASASSASRYRALKRLLQLGEPPVLLLYMIVRHFRILWKAREVRDAGVRASGEAAAKIGVPPFVAKKALDQAARWSREEFERVFMRLALADLSLKSGGGRRCWTSW